MSGPSVDAVLRISHIFIVVELVLIDLKYISFESRSKWKRKNINKSVYLPKRTDGLLTALSIVALTIKTSTSSEACIVKHPFSANFLLRFCLYFESARNCSFFDLKSVYSVNSTLAPTVVPIRLKCAVYH